MGKPDFAPYRLQQIKEYIRNAGDTLLFLQRDGTQGIFLAWTDAQRETESNLVKKEPQIFSDLIYKTFREKFKALRDWLTELMKNLDLAINYLLTGEKHLSKLISRESLEKAAGALKVFININSLEEANIKALKEQLEEMRNYFRKRIKFNIVSGALVGTCATPIPLGTLLVPILSLAEDLKFFKELGRIEKEIGAPGEACKYGLQENKKLNTLNGLSKFLQQLFVQGQAQGPAEDDGFWEGWLKRLKKKFNKFFEVRDFLGMGKKLVDLIQPEGFCRSEIKNLRVRHKLAKILGNVRWGDLGVRLQDNYKNGFAVLKEGSSIGEIDLNSKDKSWEEALYELVVGILDNF